MSLILPKRLYGITLEQFHNEQERILWAHTFFKGGCAAKWSENVFRQEADTSVFPIQTWGEFEQQFQLHFFPANVEADVERGKREFSCD